MSYTLNNFQNTSHCLSRTNHLVRQPLGESSSHSRLLVPAGKIHPPPVHVKKTPPYGTFYFSFPATLLALAEWAQQLWISGRILLLKRSEKRLKGRDSLQPGMEPETMWKSWMEIQWDPVHCNRRGGITGRKSSEKKKSYCYLGWILVLGREGVGGRDYFPSLAKIFFCLIRGKTTFCLNFLVSKNTFNLSVRGGEERMLEQNIFSTVTWKVILMNDNLLSIIIPKYKIGSVFYVIWNGVWSYWQGCWLPGGS